MSDPRGPVVVVTRDERVDDGFSRALTALGARPVSLQTIRVEPAAGSGAPRRRTRRDGFVRLGRVHERERRGRHLHPGGLAHRVGSPAPPADCRRRSRHQGAPGRQGLAGGRDADASECSGSCGCPRSVWREAQRCSCALASIGNRPPGSIRGVDQSRNEPRRARRVPVRLRSHPRAWRRSAAISRRAALTQSRSCRRRAHGHSPRPCRRAHSRGSLAAPSWRASALQRPRCSRPWEPRPMSSHASEALPVWLTRSARR